MNIYPFLLFSMLNIEIIVTYNGLIVVIIKNNVTHNIYREYGLAKFHSARGPRRSSLSGSRPRVFMLPAMCVWNFFRRTSSVVHTRHMHTYIYICSPSTNTRKGRSKAIPGQISCRSFGNVLQRRVFGLMYGEKKIINSRTKKTDARDPTAATQRNKKLRCTRSLLWIPRRYTVYAIIIGYDEHNKRHLLF